MLTYVLRCWRVPIRVGKAVRHAMRRHWGLSHHAARVVYHASVGSALVCVAVPAALWALPPPGIVAPPLAPGPGGGIVAPPLAPGPAVPLFVPGQLYYPFPRAPMAGDRAANTPPADTRPERAREAAGFGPAGPPVTVPEPTLALGFWLLVVGILVQQHHRRSP